MVINVKNKDGYLISMITFLVLEEVNSATPVLPDQTGTRLEVDESTEGASVRHTTTHNLGEHVAVFWYENNMVKWYLAIVDRLNKDSITLSYNDSC